MTIVAAWISAETGVGPSIASGEPRVQRDLRGLRERADEQQDAAGDEVAVVVPKTSPARSNVAEEVERPGARGR